MADYAKLKDAITQVIKTNGNQEITGQILQNTLLSIVNVIGEERTFAGVATPDTNPGNPDQNVIWAATQKGTYTGFGNYVHDGVGIAFIGNTSSGWQAVKMNVVGVDSDGNPVNPDNYVTREAFNAFREKLGASLEDDSSENNIHAQYDNHGNVIFDYYASKESVTDLSKSIGSEKGSESEDGSVWGKLISLGNDGLELSQEISDLSVKMDNAFTQNGFIWTFAGDKVEIVFKDNGNTSIAFPQETTVSYGNTSVLCDMGISMIEVPAATKNLYIVFNISKGKYEVVTAQNQMNGTVLLGWISNEVKTALLRCSNYSVNGRSMNPVDYLSASDIVDGLVSTSVDKPLSANMGRNLSTQNGMMQCTTLGSKVEVNFNANATEVTISLPPELYISYGNSRIVNAATSSGTVVKGVSSDSLAKYLVYNLITNSFEIVKYDSQMKDCILLGWMYLKASLNSCVLLCDKYSVNGVSRSFADYIPKSDIVHNLTTTDVNKVLGADQAAILATQNGWLFPRNKGGIHFKNVDSTTISLTIEGRYSVSWGNTVISNDDTSQKVISASNVSSTMYLIYHIDDDTFTWEKAAAQMNGNVLLGWYNYVTDKVFLRCDEYTIDGMPASNNDLAEIAYNNIPTTVIQLKKHAEDGYVLIQVKSLIDTEIKITGGYVSFNTSNFTETSIDVKKETLTNVYFRCVEQFAIVEAKGIYQIIVGSNLAYNYVSQNIRDFGSLLTYFVSNYNNGITGEIKDFNRNMNYISIGGGDLSKPKISGELKDLPRLLTHLHLASGGISINGDVADLPRKLNHLYLNTSLRPIGNPADLPKGLTYLSLYNLNNEFYGDIADFPKGLTSLTLSGTNYNISGNITDLPPNVQALQISGVSTVHGDISELPRSLRSMSFFGNCTLKGSLSDLPASANVFNLQSADPTTPIIGDISDIPNKEIIHFSIIKNFNVTFNGDFPISGQLYYFMLQPSEAFPIDSATVDNILIKLAAIAGERTGARTLNLTGACAAPTEASQAAIESLQQKGFTVQTN